MASQRAQIVGDVVELPDYGRIAEVAGRGISGPAEGDRADVTRLAGQRLDEARVAAAELIKLDPNLRLARAREMFPLRKAEFRSKLDEALRAAGLPE
jgi:hypothetical protein